MANKAEVQKKINSTFSTFRRPIMLVAALIILLIGYFAVLSEPLRVYQANYSLLGKLNSDISVAQSDLATSKIYSDKLYKASPLEAKLLEMALPSKPDDSAMVSQLSAMAQRAGFSASSIDLEETNAVAANKTASDKIGKTSIRLKLRGGGYPELKQLLKLMESSLMMIDVYSINFTEKSPVYDLTLVTYYYNSGVKAK